jgi:hypothetical protein
VHAGGQAVVGVVESPGGGDRPISEDQPHAKQNCPIHLRRESARDCEAVAGREGSCEAGELSNDVGCPLHAVRCCSLGLKDSLYCEIAHIWERRCLRRAQTPPDPFDGPGGGGRALKRSRPVRGFRTGTKSSSACPEAIPPVGCRRWPTRAAEMPMRLAVG